MKIDEALEILEETPAEVQMTKNINQLNKRLVQIERELRKRAKSDPGSRTIIEPVIGLADEAEALLFKLKRKFSFLEAKAKDFHI